MPAAKKVSPERWASLQGDVVRLNEVLRVKDETLFERKLEIAEKAEAIRIKDILCFGLKAQLKEAQAAAELQRQVAEEAITSLRDDLDKQRHKAVAELSKERQNLAKERIAAAKVMDELYEDRRALTEEILQGEEAMNVISAALESLLQQTTDLAEKVQLLKLQAPSDQLLALRKDLVELCTCPLTFKLMRQPVIGTDTRTYQKDAIEEALTNKPASPFTRAPMEMALLRPNMLAADLLGLVAKHFPSLEEDGLSITVEKPPPVGQELVTAICKKKSDEALELLGRETDLDYLNGAYKHGSFRMSLLHVSICLGLPKVAHAIIMRPDFRRVETYSEQGLLALHLAAAYNYADVCAAILDDYPYLRNRRTHCRAELLSVAIPAQSTALDCARLCGHVPSWANGNEL